MQSMRQIASELFNTIALDTGMSFQPEIVQIERT